MSKAELYESPISDEIFSEITPEEAEKTKKRMLLAAKIDDAMKAKGWKKGDLAREMKKHPSVITRWLSGTHNFETDTLFELEDKLGINLVYIGEKQKEQISCFHISLTQKVNTAEFADQLKNEPNIYYQSVACVNNCSSNC
jgi:ribosome-binding protein aMBF1 (putative translation factor)